MRFKKMYLLMYKYLRLQNNSYTNLHNYIIELSKLFPKITSITLYLKTEGGLIQTNILGQPLKYTSENIKSFEMLEFVYFDNTKKYIFGSKIGDIHAKILPNKLEQNKIFIPIYIEQKERKPIKIGFIIISGENLTIETTKKRVANIRDTMIFLSTVFSSVSQTMYNRLDNLTGLITRKELNFELNELLHKKPKDISVVILDIDFFKNINDTYGHDAGDEVLKQFSHRILSKIRTYDRQNILKDIVVRWGGEEFIIILPNTNLKKALGITKRIKNIVSTKEYYIGNDRNIKVTASLGVVSIKQTNLAINREAIFELINLADKALYVAKQTGRNKICVYNQEDCTQNSLKK